MIHCSLEPGGNMTIKMIDHESQTSIRVIAAMALVICLLAINAMAACFFLLMPLTGIWWSRLKRFSMQLPGAEPRASRVYPRYNAWIGAPLAIAVRIATSLSTADMPEGPQRFPTREARVLA